jgi:hypothetical protein
MNEHDAYFDSLLEEFDTLQEMEELLNTDGEFAFLDTDRSVKDRNKKLLAYHYVNEAKDENPRKRRASKRSLQDRLAPWLFVEHWSDAMFSRQFRMPRSRFYEILRRVIDKYPGNYDDGKKNYSYSCQQGDNAHGHHILLQIKMCVTLRLLAGASYLDMIWYGVHVDYVDAMFEECLKLIDIALPNQEIFDFNEDTDFDEMAHEWSSIMIARKFHDLMKGTILAGDGLVVEIAAPSAKERAGLDVNAYRNRKGYPGLIVQGFCDAFCMFRSFDIRCPGATPDITAYKQSPLYHMFMNGKVPDGYHMVLDEAYSSIGGNQHLTPFSRNQLRNAKERSEDTYCRMKAFNHALSSQRITIERAFGILVRKWGILWRPLCYSLKMNTLVVKICAKLHNFCIQGWKETGSRSDEIHAIQEDYQMYKDAGVFLGWGNDRLLDEGQDIPDDAEIMDMMGNHLPPPPGVRAARLNPGRAPTRRDLLMQSIYDVGVRYNLRQDDYYFIHRRRNAIR